MAKTDALQGSLDLLVLKILSRRPRLHGYAIMAAIANTSGEVLRAEEGSLYPALYRMEEAGWIRAEWIKKDSGRRARVYELTAAGKKQLGAEESPWQSTGFSGRPDMSLWSRISNAVHGERLNRDMDEEFQSHIEEAIASGRDPEEARRAFGSMLRVREASSIRVAGWLESLLADVTFGWRQLCRNKVTSVAAVLSLALGI